jgi:hypothetical protein
LENVSSGMINGTVSISVADFDDLRQKAKQLETLKKELNGCTSVKFEEVGHDNWVQIITVNAARIAKVAADFSGVEEVYDGDEILFENVQLSRMQGFEKTLSPFHLDLLDCSYPIDRVLKFTAAEAQEEYRALTDSN